MAIDVGGTTTKGAVVDRHGTIRLRHRASTGRADSQDVTVRQLADFIRDLRQMSAGDSPVACGVVVPGIVDEASGTAVFASNLGWRDVPIRQLCEAAFGGPVAVGQDVRGAALAESVLGAARGVRDHLFIALGTGIGAALTISGRPYAGTHFGAGEIGHLVVERGGTECRCGNRGCLETIASGAAICERYRKATGQSSGLTAQEVARRVGADDRIASQIWASAIQALAGALATSVTLLDPTLIVIGGGVALAGDRLLRPLRERLRAELTVHGMPELARAELGDESGVAGAALMAWSRVGIGEHEFGWQASH